MGGIKQEQSDASQQPKPPHSADQRQDEVGTGKTFASALELGPPGLQP